MSYINKFKTGKNVTQVNIRENGYALPIGIESTTFQIALGRATFKLQVYMSNLSNTQRRDGPGVRAPFGDSRFAYANGNCTYTISRGCNVLQVPIQIIPLGVPNQRAILSVADQNCDAMSSDHL